MLGAGFDLLRPTGFTGSALGLTMNVSARILNADSRAMPELADGSIDLAVTSPPYWHLKDYGSPGQIGYGQTLHAYLTDLYRVWSECHRVIRSGGRLCINVGDQFARSVVYGRYKVIPLHSEMIAQAEQNGFDFLGSIIWQKKTTMNTTGGATVMGSFPHPPNGIVEIDYEHILIFKKPGANKQVSKAIKESSKLTKEQWKEYFIGHWNFGGARQVHHEAMFPEELPERLIRMFSFVGDTVLDPFLGSGTTAKVALQNGRSAVGYEYNEAFIDIIREKLGVGGERPALFRDQIHFEHRAEPVELSAVAYTPTIQDASPVVDPKKIKSKNGRLYKVVAARSADELELDTGLRVRLLGVRVRQPEAAIAYLRDSVVGKQVTLEFDRDSAQESDRVDGYVHLKNRIFVNSYMVRSGLADADRTVEHRMSRKFQGLEAERDEHAQGVGA